MKNEHYFNGFLIYPFKRIEKINNYKMDMDLYN